MKRILAYMMIVCIALSILGGTAYADTFVTNGTVVYEVGAIADAFGKADTKMLSDLEVDEEIQLTGTVTITEKGVYHITGEAANAVITVNDTAKSGNITLILEDLQISNDGTPAIIVESADKVILWIAGDCSIAMNGSGADMDAAIYAKDDLTVTGTGTLTITSDGDGIACSDDFKQTGVVLAINAAGAGLNVNDSVRIGGGTLDIVSGKDGIHLSNKALDSWFYLEDGTVTIQAGQDGIDVSSEEDSFTGFIHLYGGSLTITSGSSGYSAWGSSASMKGLKCQGDIYIGDTVLSISSSDDAIHSGASISVTGGSLALASGDDGIHADSILSISGGSVLVSQSYEGLEAYEIDVSGGEIRVYASDDGINAAGGSDTSSQEMNPWARWDMTSSSSGILNISGGSIYVNAEGDGLDSNGSIYVTGGLVIVEGPTNDGNGAIDKGDSNGCVASITGGTVLAIGSTGMAVNFGSGTQCSALVAVNGKAGDTITVDDGSGFSFTASKSFNCAVYSSPALAQGSSYTLTAGSASAGFSFTSGLYYSDTYGGFGGMGGWGQPGGGMGGFGGGPGGGFGGRGR